jgi:hypothetical protein
MLDTVSAFPAGNRVFSVLNMSTATYNGCRDEIAFARPAGGQDCLVLTNAAQARVGAEAPRKPGSAGGITETRASRSWEYPSNRARLHGRTKRSGSTPHPRGRSCQATQTSWPGFTRRIVTRSIRASGVRSSTTAASRWDYRIVRDDGSLRYLHVSRPRAPYSLGSAQINRIDAGDTDLHTQRCSFSLANTLLRPDGELPDGTLSSGRPPNQKNPVVQPALCCRKLKKKNVGVPKDLVESGTRIRPVLDAFDAKSASPLPS